MPKLLFALLLIPLSFAQENSIAIEGPGIKAQTLQITPRDCTPPYALIGGHAEFKRFIQTACGISLKAALLQAGFVPNTRAGKTQLIEVQAKDGYQAFFTYMELFNLLDESRLPVLATLENSLPIKKDGPVVLHAPADKATGPRHVKWVTKVILHDLKQLSGTSPE